MTQNVIPGEDFSRRFRNALGMFATGITVVSTRTPAGAPIGLTVNSFNSVSLDPPLIVWSLAKELPSRDLFEGCEYYAINVLAEDQTELSQRFASRAGARFAVGRRYVEAQFVVDVEARPHADRIAVRHQEAFRGGMPHLVQFADERAVGPHPG